MRISDWSSDVCSSDLPRWTCSAQHAQPWIKSMAPPCWRWMPRPARKNGFTRLCATTCGTLTYRWRSEEHTSELQSLMRISYAVFCLKKKKKQKKYDYIRKK